MPVVAAIMVPIMVTDKANPPEPFLTILEDSLRDHLPPLLSSIVPININIGTATNMRFLQTPPIFY